MNLQQFQKNRHYASSTKCKELAGVNLRNNYDYLFGSDDDGSDSDECLQFYRGTKAFSEPETVTIRDYINNKNFTAIINVESSEELNGIVMPGNYGQEYDS